MTTGPAPGDGAAAPDLRKLAQDWITLWQSELAALAVDREAQETWQAVVALWAGAASAMLQALPHEHPERRAGATAAAGAAPAFAAPDPRDAAIECLTRRIGELETRLADIERGNRSNGAGRPGARRGRGTARPRPAGDVAAERGPD
jgi:hypothetical protein